MTGPSLVVVCGDPGGAAAVASVVERLRERGALAVHAALYREAREVWRRRGLPFESLHEEDGARAARNLLVERGARALLVGTSVNSVDLERSFVAAAREVGVPSLAVLDFWSNYVLRFADGAGRLAHVPDRIAVMDERARDEMLAVGFDAETLVVTGQPAYDDLRRRRGEPVPERREALRRAAGASEGARVVLFASQPLAALHGRDASSPRFLGYTERSVLLDVLSALERIAHRASARLVLAIRAHPKEDPGDFDAVSSASVSVVVARAGEAHDWIEACDLVVGMTSSLLVEACCLGVPTLSVQPGRRAPDPLPTNRLGLSRAVYRVEDLEPELARHLLDEAAIALVRERLASFQPSGAADRVADLILAMAGAGLRSAGET